MSTLPIRAELARAEAAADAPDESWRDDYQDHYVYRIDFADGEKAWVVASDSTHALGSIEDWDWEMEDGSLPVTIHRLDGGEVIEVITDDPLGFPEEVVEEDNDFGCLRIVMTAAQWSNHYRSNRSICSTWWAP